ncbi:hypothetical protein ACT2CI_00210 [Candidatus Vidania fulgoroideorum]
MILTKIIENKIKEIKNKYKKMDIKIIKYICSRNYLREKLNEKKNLPNIIIENKKFSPLFGDLNFFKKKCKYFFIESFLIDEKFFKGKYNIKNKKKKLMKEFIIDKYQIYEGVFYFFNYFLIINFINKKFLKILHFFKKKYILENKDIKEINKKKYKKNLGINNRNLKNFSISFKKINYFIKKKINIICESGIKNINYVIKLFNMRIKKFIIGTNINKKNFYEF